jgi:hypothetical protein
MCFRIHEWELKTIYFEVSEERTSQTNMPKKPVERMEGTKIVHIYLALSLHFEGVSTVGNVAVSNASGHINHLH